MTPSSKLSFYTNVYSKFWNSETECNDRLLKKGKLDAIHIIYMEKWCLRMDFNSAEQRKKNHNRQGWRRQISKGPHNKLFFDWHCQQREDFLHVPCSCLTSFENYQNHPPFHLETCSVLWSQIRYQMPTKRKTKIMISKNKIGIWLMSHHQI